MMTPHMLTGKADGHLVPVLGSGSHRLQAEAATAFAGLQQSARRQGFNLQPASSFRDFERQRLIWNGKFRAERPLLDSNSRPLDARKMTVEARCHAILHWSALPGASRHHWGTDLDIFDPDALPAGKTLQLEPGEYLTGGYFADLTAWLGRHMADYDFYRPYEVYRGGVAPEPWHLSYRPLAQLAMEQLTPDLILASWTEQDVAGEEWLIPHLPDLFSQYILNVEKE